MNTKETSNINSPTVNVFRVKSAKFYRGKTYAKSLRLKHSKINVSKILSLYRLYEKYVIIIQY